MVAEELRYSGGLLDDIGIPDKEVKGYRAEKDYRLLDDDGIITPEVMLLKMMLLLENLHLQDFLNAMDEYNLSTNSRRESVPLVYLMEIKELLIWFY
jgi:hypothetical protein